MKDVIFSLGGFLLTHEEWDLLGEDGRAALIAASVEETSARRRSERRLRQPQGVVRSVSR